MNTLFIKNMVCNRCIMVVRNELEKLGYHVQQIKLGLNPNEEWFVPKPLQKWTE